MDFSLPFDQNIIIIHMSAVSQNHFKKIILFSFSGHCFDLLMATEETKARKIMTSQNLSKYDKIIIL